MDIKQECDDNFDLSIVKEEFIIEEINEETNYVVKIEQTDEILSDYLHDTKDIFETIKVEKTEDIKPNIEGNKAIKNRGSGKRIKKENIQYICPICGKVFQNARNLRKHKLIHNENAAFKCDHCNKEFKIKKYLLRHLKYHAELAPVSCKICKKTFDNSINFKRHLNRHMTYVKKRCHQCEICGKKYLSEQQRDEHIQKVHVKKPIIPSSFTCSVCGKVYERKRCYENHLLIHSNIVFRCAKCPRAFRRKDLLEKHLTLHLKKQLLICNICKVSFTAFTYYERHLKKHYRQPVPCFYCNRILETTDLRYGHIKRIHPGLPTSIKAGKMSCKICQCNFDNLENLKKHSELKIHQIS